MPEDATTRHHESAQPVAAVLAFLLPGLGHAYLGSVRRGVLIGASVLGLFFSGVLIGGIDVVDRKDDFWWFTGQACIGPVAFGADRFHQSMKVADPTAKGGRRAPNPDENPRFEKSLGRLNEIGALYATLAGLLNLIAIIDAGWGRGKVANRKGANSKSAGVAA